MAANLPINKRGFNFIQKGDRGGGGGGSSSAFRQHLHLLHHHQHPHPRKDESLKGGFSEASYRWRVRWRPCFTPRVHLSSR